MTILQKALRVEGVLRLGAVDVVNEEVEGLLLVHCQVKAGVEERVRGRDARLVRLGAVERIVGRGCLGHA